MTDSPMMRRVKANPAQYFHQDGALKLFNVYMWSLPVLSLVVLQKGLEKNFDKKKVDDIIFLVGKTQSFNATKWTVEKVGIPLEGNELKVLKETASHGEITGMGKTTILHFDKAARHVIASVENNVFELQHQKLHGSNLPADHYQRGLFAGTLDYLFGEEMVVCASIKAQKLIFEALPKREAIHQEKFRDFIPSEELDTSFLQDLTIKKLLQ